jgi:hypothetical protein
MPQPPQWSLRRRRCWSSRAPESCCLAAPSRRRAPGASAGAARPGGAIGAAAPAEGWRCRGAPAPARRPPRPGPTVSMSSQPVSQRGAGEVMARSRALQLQRRAGGVLDARHDRGARFAAAPRPGTATLSGQAQCPPAPGRPPPLARDISGRARQGAPSTRSLPPTSPTSRERPPLAACARAHRRLCLHPRPQRPAAAAPTRGAAAAGAPPAPPDRRPRCLARRRGFEDFQTLWEAHSSRGPKCLRGELPRGVPRVWMSTLPAGRPRGGPLRAASPLMAGRRAGACWLRGEAAAPRPRVTHQHPSEPAGWRPAAVPCSRGERLPAQAMGGLQHHSRRARGAGRAPPRSQD